MKTFAEMERDAELIEAQRQAAKDERESRYAQLAADADLFGEKPVHGRIDRINSVIWMDTADGLKMFPIMEGRVIKRHPDAHLGAVSADAA